MTELAVPLRVLIVSHGHPEQSTGGAEIASYLLFRQLRQAEGVAAFFLAATDEPPVSAPTPVFIPFRGRADEFLFSPRLFDRFLFSQPAAAVVDAFTALLQRLNPDVIHFHHYLKIGLELLGAARRFKPGVRIILTLHEYLAICHHHGTMVRTRDGGLCEAAHEKDCAACFADIGAAGFARRRRHIQAYFEKVDVFLAPSEFLRRRYVDWGLPAWRIASVENGIDPPIEAPAPRPLAAGEGRGVFGFFGQIHPFKGLLELLAAFDELAKLPRQATEGIRLMIHGAYLELNHPDYAFAVRRLLAQNPGRVCFAGPYDRADQCRLMAGVDWVVVPSIWWENSPLVIEEALAHRRPVICSNIGGMAEKVRPGRDGFHFPAGDAHALASLVLRLARDRAIWNHLQSSIRRPVSIQESAAHHLEIYRDRSAALHVQRRRRGDRAASAC